MSDVQESAQLLSGREFPVAILEALWNKAKIPAGKMMLVNVTPYDGWLEKICLEWGRNHAKQEIQSLSIAESSKSIPLDYCQKTLAMELLEDRCWW